MDSHVAQAPGHRPDRYPGLNRETARHTPPALSAHPHRNPRTWLRAALLGLALLAPQVHAALAVGQTAPPVRTEAALAGKPMTFELAQALKRGPVVLYFFPKAFTQGCTIEANAFAEASPQFGELGATVIGMSHDDIATLTRFSSEACRDRFAVAADPQGQTIRAYDAEAAARPGMAQRISYVIATDGRIAFVHAGADPLEHVSQTLQAVKALRAKPAPKP
jgi:peroxiredoxin